MQVIGAGFGRTGTLSLKAALEQLGCGPCFHMLDLIEHPDRAPEWGRAAAGEPVDWDRLLAGYAATVDWPGATFYAQLAERHPEAKVLLTVRDPDRWYDSVMNTIHAVRQAARDGGLRGGAVDPRPEVFAVIDRIIWEGTFGGRAEDRDHAIAVFERHNAEVRRTIPADRLLVHEIGDGWEPLCAHLGRPVPDAAFPHLNDTEAFRRMVGMPALART